MSQPNLVGVAEDWCRSEEYHFKGIAGKGAFKETFRVLSPENQLLALKIYESAPTHERSLREIEAMKRCHHPHIARIISFGTHEYDGKTFGYFTERFIEGGTLTTRISGELLSRGELLNMGAKLVDGLTHLKELDLVHRDIKPDNIMLDGDGVGSPVLVDFGLVRDLQARSLTQTHLAMGPGTPLFSSPEQLNNDKEMIGWQSDQFSLGIVLTISLLGVHPFDKTGSKLGQLINEDRNDVLQSIVNGIATRAAIVPEIVHQLRNLGLPVVLKMLKPWPAQRYAATPQLLEAWVAQTEAC